MIYRQRSGGWLKARESCKRNRSAAGRRYVHLIQPAGILPKDRIYLHHDEILIHRFECACDLPLSEGVVQNIIDSLRCYT